MIILRVLGYPNPGQSFMRRAMGWEADGADPGGPGTWAAKKYFLKPSVPLWFDVRKSFLEVCFWHRGSVNSVTIWPSATFFFWKRFFAKIEFVTVTEGFSLFKVASGEAVYTDAPSCNLFFWVFEKEAYRRKRFSIHERHKVLKKTMYF